MFCRHSHITAFYILCDNQNTKTTGGFSYFSSIFMLSFKLSLVDKQTEALVRKQEITAEEYFSRIAKIRED